MTLTTGQIAAMTEGELRGSPDVVIHAVQLLHEAGPHDLAYIGDPAHARRWGDARAVAALIARKLDVADPPGKTSIRVDDVDLALAKVLDHFAPPPVLPAPGVHPTAVIDRTAKVAENCRIGPFCIIGPHADIGDGCVLYDRVTLGAHVVVGRSVTLRSGVVIGDRCEVGNHTTLHPGVVVGADGFGYRPAADGQSLVKIPQIGNVVIGRDVEIGANTCIDRAKFGSTVIGDGCKIDNLVQIGHNCRLGRSVIIAGQSGLAGSVTIGDGVIIGGASALKDHLTIGPGVSIAGGSHVMNNIPAGETWGGSPAQEIHSVFRQIAALRNLPDVMKKVRKHLKSLDE